jgi:transcription antitermination factor NusG
MPLLLAEPYVYPETLLTAAGPGLEDPDAHWWVLHCRPRTEKALARQLLGRSVSFFLPVYHRRWQSRGRLLSSYPPLFSGYLFLYGDANARLVAVETNHVVNTLTVVHQEQLTADLTQIRRMMDVDVLLTPEERLLPGTIVEIIAGPLAGLEGKIIKRGRQHHFVLEVRLLQQGVSVEIDSWMFRVIETSTRSAVS